MTSRRPTIPYLRRMKDLPDFSLGDARVDVRGWQVYSNDAQLVGLVDSMFIDMETECVRYLGVSLTDSKVRDANGVVLVPVGSASCLQDRCIVVLSALTRAQLTSAPRLVSGPITRRYEDATLATYGMATSRDVHRGELYTSPHFAEERLFEAAEPWRPE